MSEKTNQDLTPGELSKLLRAAGAKNVTVEAIKADIAAGAPTEADGRLNFIAYAAWLVSESSG